MPVGVIVARSVGARLKAERERQKYGQIQLAKMAGIGQSTLSEIENGAGPLKLPAMIDVARALRVPFASLLPPEDQTLDVRGLASVLNEMDEANRAAFIEGILAMMEVWRRRLPTATVQDVAAGRGLTIVS